MYYTYILYSAKLNTFYKGQTKDITKRTKRHNAGLEKSTKNGRPWQLLWSTTKESRPEAVKLETKLKNLSRSKLIDFMIKYSEEIEGPDELLLLQQMSGY